MAGKVTRRAVGTVVAVVGACLAYAAVKAAHGPTRRNGFVRSFQHFPSERDRGFESVYLFHGNRRSVSSRACVRGGDRGKSRHPQRQHNRGTGPMSPTASIRVGFVIPFENSISISVASGTSGSNPLSSSGESGANLTSWMRRRPPRSGCLAGRHQPQARADDEPTGV
jgi:hypothetical protein